MRSKVHWGYDADFIARAMPDLTVRPEWIEAGLILVAESERLLAGVAGITDEGGGEFDVSVFFVDPPFMGKGVGRLLFQALAELARTRGGKRLTILADPNAGRFYERMGAVQVGKERSGTSGRVLPLFHFRLGSGSRHPADGDR
ncbi:GNAT family N-acetyltransferase [Oricola cellulosilytica]|uniref:GNAT family N-acetyltransferase n=1 Tax=Oricola cellulosilytica TaxID=1429082 RepID=A0A4R0PGM7_9HYPH|nr:GNAT family N-acetyltransferase [Oricola cellulosilytica]TCD16053.1 GNAT family N-acetyltransferase [Oricola cellulosilytica]